MRISNEVRIGLKRLANPAVISDENLSKLLRETSNYLSDPKNYKKVGIEPNLAKVDILKECFASLLCLLVESCRRNVETDILISTLASCNFNSNRSDEIMKLYVSHKRYIEKSLLRVVSEPPHIYNASWKLHFCVKSSFSDLEEKLIYMIEFHVVQNGSGAVRKISFFCTLQHLQDLVWKLKAAVRRLESLAGAAADR